jgi:predicted dehydrogenase
VGLVGLGRLSEVGYLPALGAVESAELVAVADARIDRCSLLAPDVPAFVDAHALVQSEVELVVVATPPAAHLETAAAAAEAGIASLVEKPPALSTADAGALASLVPRPWLAFNRRFDRDVGRLRSRVAAFRHPLRLSLELSIRPGDWGAHAAPPGPLLDLGPHLVDLAGWITGRSCDAVRAERVDDTEARFELALEGASAFVVASYDAAWREAVSVADATGSTARLVRGGTARRLRARLAGGRSPLVASLTEQLAAVCRAVGTETRDPRLATAADGVVLMGVLEAVSASARQGGAWVELAEGRVSTCLP